VLVDRLVVMSVVLKALRQKVVSMAEMLESDQKVALLASLKVVDLVVQWVICLGILVAVMMVVERVAYMVALKGDV